MRRVIVESPFAGDIRRNKEYLRKALRDCLGRGEAPFASHAIYTQAGVLNDLDPEERTLGITAGLYWAAVAEATVVYLDLGITDGMRVGILDAQASNRPIEYRYLEH
jgi:hypothetical protein